MKLKGVVVVAAALTLAGCATWSTSSIDSASTSDAQTTSVAPPKRTDPSKIYLTDKDITDHKYVSLGDINVTVNKTTIFNADPTRANVDEKLREEAAKLGADAVILVRYGTVGVGFMSWGSLDGKGRAVKYIH